MLTKMLMPLLSPDALHAPPDRVSRCIIVRSLHQLPELLSQFVHCPSPFQEIRSTVMLEFAKLTACALVFSIATLTQQPFGTSTIALT